MTKKEKKVFNKKIIQESKRRHGDSIESWKRNIEDAIITSYDYLKKYPKNTEKKFESVRLLLKDGLALLENRTYKENFSEGREIFYHIKNVISKEESKAILSKEIDKYRKDLALRGGLLIEKSHLKRDFDDRDAEILRYYDRYIGNRAPGLEKSITIVSLVSMILGISIGYPALTGNLIAESVTGSAGYGAILFLVGLLGVFLANKR